MTEHDQPPETLRFGPLDLQRTLTGPLLQGLQAAGAMAERFASGFESPASGPSWTSSDDDQSDRGPSDADADPIAELRATRLRLMEVFSQMLDTTFDSYLGLLQNQTPSPAAPPVVLTAEAGAIARGEIWLHGTGSAEMDALDLRVTDLSNADGSTIRAGDIILDPASVPLREQVRSSVSIEVKVPIDATTGHYFGLVMAPQLQDQALVVHVEVVPDQPVNPG